METSHVTTILQCHSDGTECRNDFVTNVYDCAFEPDVDNPGSFTNVAATCGGDRICFIDVTSGKILSAYREKRKYNGKFESFNSIDWSIVTTKKNKITRLAAGGLHGDVKLIFPSIQACVFTFEASKKQLSLLRNYPTDSSVIFTGCDDRYVRAWKVPSMDAIRAAREDSALIHGAKAKSIGQVKMKSPFDFVTALEVLVDLKFLIVGTEDNLYCCRIKLDQSNCLSELCVINVNPNIPVAMSIDSVCIISEDIVGLLLFGSEYIYICKPWSRPGSNLLNLSLTWTLEGNNRSSKYTSLSYCSYMKFLTSGSDDGSISVHLEMEPKRLRVAAREATKVKPVDIILQWPQCYTGKEDSSEDGLYRFPKLFKAISNGRYILSVTECNLVCIWKI